MVLGIQLVGIIFTIGISYFTYVNYKRKDLNKSEVIFWETTWFFLLYVTIFPQSLNFILKTLSITRALDFLTIVGFLFLMLITFHNYIIVKKNNNRISSLVRKLAIDKKK